MKVIILAAAEDDLEQIGDFIARDNPTRALSYVQELRAACGQLGEAPLRYELVSRYSRSGIRRRPFGRYLIFYRIFPDRVEVQRVLHGGRDLSAGLDT